jgi:hypothetical protein
VLNFASCSRLPRRRRVKTGGSFSESGKSRNWLKTQQLIAAHGPEVRLPGLLTTLANCEKARSVSVHDRCKAGYEGL